MMVELVSGLDGGPKNIRLTILIVPHNFIEEINRWTDCMQRSDYLSVLGNKLE